MIEFLVGMPCQLHKFFTDPVAPSTAVFVTGKCPELLALQRQPLYVNCIFQV